MDMFRVVSLERSIMRLVKMDQNRHYLAWAELACTLSLVVCCQSVSFPLWFKAKPKIIDLTKRLE